MWVLGHGVRVGTKGREGPLSDGSTRVVKGRHHRTAAPDGWPDLMLLRSYEGEGVPQWGPGVGFESQTSASDRFPGPPRRALGGGDQ